MAVRPNLSERAVSGMEKIMAVAETVVQSSGIYAACTPRSLARNSKNILDELPMVKSAATNRYFLNAGGRPCSFQLNPGAATC